MNNDHSSVPPLGGGPPRLTVFDRRTVVFGVAVERLGDTENVSAAKTNGESDDDNSKARTAATESSPILREIN